MKTCFPPSAISALSLIVLISLSIQQSHAETPTERAQWKTKIQWPDICEQNLSSIIKYSSNFVGVSVDKWTNGQRIISVVCEPGLYNRGKMLFLEHASDEADNKKQYTTLNFTTFGQIKDNPDYAYSKPTQHYRYFQKSSHIFWGNLNVDSTTGTMTNRNFYRGPGGCGILTQYTIEKGKAVVSELRMKTDCDETMPPPEEWRLYPKSEYATWPKVVQ
ncbi:hypothetical protein L4C36_16050 [Photobacterium japonica]|uniref:hypothetical protein n=1 Tax=Photobacterium japonica TaxID=2910235 RepID=UPI003D0DC3E8